MWELYDSLVASVPEDVQADDVRVSTVWSLVGARETGSLGLALNLDGGAQLREVCGHAHGRTLRELAAAVRSWDFCDASVGLAAINAAHNRRELLRDGPRCVTGRRGGVFGAFDDMVRGKRVALIGHGAFAEGLADVCDLTILERKPWRGDLPDSACEYVLPEQDFVFVTASALVNKTMPRLLELSRDAVCVVWGPSAPLGEELLEAGADAVLGQVVTDARLVARAAGEGGIVPDFAAGVEPVALFADERLASRYRAGAGA